MPSVVGMLKAARNPRFLSLVTALVVLGALVSACGIEVAEDGPARVEKRSVGAFGRVEIYGSPRVVIRPGRSGDLTINGGANRIHDLSTTVDSGTLVIEQADSSATINLGGGGVTVVVHTRRLVAAEVHGSAEVSLPATAAADLHLSIDGSGEIQASGKVGRLKAEVHGSGELDLGGLQATDAAIAMFGSGNAKVSTSRQLAAHIDGSARVGYRGNPAVTEDVSGSGIVEPG